MQHIRAHVLVCGGTGCKANGSKEIQLTFARELQKFGLQDEGSCGVICVIALANAS